MKQTLKEVTKNALLNQDLKTLSRVIDQLRSMGWNYDSIQKWMENRFGVDAQTYEEYCYNIDVMGY